MFFCLYCLFLSVNLGRGRGDGGFYQRSFDDVEGGFGRAGREMHRSQSWEERYGHSVFPLGWSFSSRGFCACEFYLVHSQSVPCLEVSVLSAGVLPYFTSGIIFCCQCENGSSPNSNPYRKLAVPMRSTCL